MKHLIKILAIIVISAGVAVPTGYFAYQSFKDSNAGMAQFIPLNSDAVIKFDLNNTTIYAFNSDNNTGIIAAIGLNQVASSIGGFGNRSSLGLNISITPSYVKTYKDYRIYDLTNITIALPRNISAFNSSAFETALNISKLTQNRTLYIADLSGSTVSIGSLNAVEMSINAMVSGKYFAAVESRYFSSGANVSFYFNYVNSYFREASGNIFLNTSNFHITFSNLTVAQKVNSALSILLGSNIKSISFDYPYLNFTLEIGISGLNGIISSVSQYGNLSSDILLK